MKNSELVLKELNEFECTKIGDCIYFDESMAVSIVPNFINCPYIKVFSYRHSNEQTKKGYFYLPSKGTEIFRISLLEPRYIGSTYYRLSSTQLKHFTAIIQLKWNDIINLYNDIHLDDWKDALDDYGIIFSPLPSNLPIPDYSLLPIPNYSLLKEEN